jgi:hypothetical protein
MNRQQNGLKILAMCALLTSPTFVIGEAKQRPIFDAHIHYSHDVWDAISPQDAIRRLRAAGVVHAMVSSSSDEGTRKLYQADPNFVIPSLRPYRKRGTTESWMYDETVIPYLKERLNSFRYVAIGEFHLKGEQAKLPVIREVIKLAREHQLMLHVHSDAEAIELIFEQDPNAHILWAHAGFEHASTVVELLDVQKNLWADLSFRWEIYGNNRFLRGWKELLLAHPDRFMLGIDTYEPQRWLKIQWTMDWQRSLLNALPEVVAQAIAYDNGNRVILDRFIKLNKDRDQSRINEKDRLVVN